MVAALPGRRVTLVLVDGAGAVLGQLPPFAVATPWWQDVEPVRASHPEVTVLRLLDATPAPGHEMGGDVRYVGEAADGAGAANGRLAPVDAATREAVERESALRLPWARPGGPAADLAWATAHIALAAPAQQVRSWNLSSIWRLPQADGRAAWLKCVPGFLAHEAVVLDHLAGRQVPVVLAAEGHRMLLGELPGVDGYGADAEEQRAIVDAHVELAASTIGATHGLLDAGVPDWRPGSFLRRATPVVRTRAKGDDVLAHFLDTWALRWAAIDECGLPDVLIHGDPHPGNARIGVDPPIIFDWGNSGIGHPLLDLGGSEPALDEYWLDRWAATVPGSDPHRAWTLLRPLAVLRRAVVFQRFLDGIEPSERVYHAGDVDPYLVLASTLLDADDNW